MAFEDRLQRFPGVELAADEENIPLPLEFRGAGSAQGAVEKLV
jgi:hypothetical protein